MDETPTVAQKKRMSRGATITMGALKKLFGAYPNSDFTIGRLGSKVNIRTYDLRAKKSEIEKVLGKSLTSEYMGDGALKFVYEDKYVRFVFQYAQKCERIGTKTVVKQVEEEVEPAHYQTVTKSVEVPIWRCAEGKEFEG